MAKMHHIFLKAVDAEVRIDHYGSATSTTPALVPSAVAKEFASDPRFRIEATDIEEPAAPKVATQVAYSAAVADDSLTYHAANGDVYHTDPECSIGNNIERKNRRRGTGGLVPCPKCVTAAPAAEERK